MAHAARRIWAQKRIERGAYHAPNFMHSVHLDLACKLQQYNLYVAAMIDGDSRMCLALRAIRTKIPFVIYTTVFLPCVLAFGCPDQLITDKGHFWKLLVPVQRVRCLHQRRLRRVARHRRHAAPPTLPSVMSLESPIMRPESRVFKHET